MTPRATDSRKPKTVFYARVSTRDQKADLQLDAARRLGIPSDNIVNRRAILTPLMG